MPARSNAMTTAVFHQKGRTEAIRDGASSLPNGDSYFMNRTMSTEPTPLSVTHNSAACRFEMTNSAVVAKLDYSIADAIMTITHTFVPPELRGQNIAGQLARAAFDFARAQDFKVVPDCSYIEAYAKRHPEAAALLA